MVQQKRLFEYKYPHMSLRISRFIDVPSNWSLFSQQYPIR